MGRSVLVTGGSRGIGRAVAEEFLAGGDQVAVLSRSGEAPPGALGIAADTSDAGAVDAAFAAAEEAHGPVTVAVANAGITRDTLVLRMSDEDFGAVLDVNLGGAFRVARRAAKSMLRARQGRIVLVGSVVGMLGSPGQVNYAASKAGLIGMARSLARELGSRGVTTNVVAPGFVETDMTGELTEERREQILASVPLGRYATPQEVSAVVAFLASDAAGYITGAVVPVDGGLGMGH